MKMMNTPAKAIRIVVFAKAPLPGLAKTRLSPLLGAIGAADLAKRLLAHCITEALESLHDIDEPQDLQWLPAGWLP